MGKRKTKEAEQNPVGSLFPTVEPPKQETRVKGSKPPAVYPFFNMKKQDSRFRICKDTGMSEADLLSTLTGVPLDLPQKAHRNALLSERILIGLYEFYQLRTRGGE